MSHSIAVIGAGSWGTALAKLLADKGEKVLLWGHEAKVVEGINRVHRNPLYLSDIRLPRSLVATASLEEAVQRAAIVVSVVPSHALRKVWKIAGKHLDPRALLISCTKGIEGKSFKLMTQVLDELLPEHAVKRRVVLSGPSFAHEAARGLPTSVVIAGREKQFVRAAQTLFRTSTFLPFTSTDLIGVQVGGAIKNIIAIAAGLSDGLKLGHNARAAIITRGVYEMIQVGLVLGADQMTFAGLSGLGDLVLTCTDEQSRNFSVGKAIAEGRGVDEVLGKGQMVAEGMATAYAVAKLKRKYRLKLPICTAVHRILTKDLKPREAVVELTAMPIHEEMRLKGRHGDSQKTAGDRQRTR